MRAGADDLSLFTRSVGRVAVAQQLAGGASVVAKKGPIRHAPKAARATFPSLAGEAGEGSQ
jgi:hypothetical protein